MAYPITIDDNTTIPVETASTPLSTNHINNHTETRSAVIALESKVGVNNSAVTSTHDYKLNEVTGVDKAVGKTAAQAISNKTITASTLNGVNLTNAGGTSNFLRADGTYATPVIAGGSNTNYIQDSGIANAYVATLIPALGAYAAGVIVEFRATNANTGASTVNVNGLGVKSIFKLNGSTALASDDIAVGQVVTLRYDGTNFQMLSPVANALTNPIFGDGSDGDIVINTNTSLTRDMYYNNLTINSGFVLNPNGYRIFARRILTTIGTGIIARNGNNAVSATGGALLADGTIKGSGAGGNGGANGSVGTPGTGSFNSIGGGAAGNGGNGAGSAGASAGGLTQTTISLTSPSLPLNLSALIVAPSSLIYPTLTPNLYTSAAAGGGGSSGGGPGSAGGGGNGGGIVMVAANIINFSANNSIQAKGGSGGNAVAGGGTGVGGGGAGGGGVIILIFLTNTGVALLNSSCVNAGIGGTGADGGGAGLSGSAGTLYSYQIK